MNRKNRKCSKSFASSAKTQNAHTIVKVFVRELSILSAEKKFNSKEFHRLMKSQVNYKYPNCVLMNRI